MAKTSGCVAVSDTSLRGSVPHVESPGPSPSRGPRKWLRREGSLSSRSSLSAFQAFKTASQETMDTKMGLVMSGSWPLF